jgi:hypothetical protein
MGMTVEGKNDEKSKANGEGQGEGKERVKQEEAGAGFLPGNDGFFLLTHT